MEPNLAQLSHLSNKQTLRLRYILGAKPYQLDAEDVALMIKAIDLGYVVPDGNRFTAIGRMRVDAAKVLPGSDHTLGAGRLDNEFLVSLFRLDQYRDAHDAAESGALYPLKTPTATKVDISVLKMLFDAARTSALSMTNNADAFEIVLHSHDVSIATSLTSTLKMTAVESGPSVNDFSLCLLRSHDYEPTISGFENADDDGAIYLIPLNASAFAESMMNNKQWELLGCIEFAAKNAANCLDGNSDITLACAVQQGGSVKYIPFDELRDTHSLVVMSGQADTFKFKASQRPTLLELCDAALSVRTAKTPYVPSNKIHAWQEGFGGVPRSVDKNSVRNNLSNEFELMKFIANTDRDVLFNDPLMSDVDFLSQKIEFGNRPLAHLLAGLYRFQLGAAQQPEVLNIKDERGFPLSYYLMSPSMYSPPLVREINKNDVESPLFGEQFNHGKLSMIKTIGDRETFLLESVWALTPAIQLPMLKREFTCQSGAPHSDSQTLRLSAYDALSDSGNYDLKASYRKMIYWFHDNPDLMEYVQARVELNPGRNQRDFYNLELAGRHTRFSDSLAMVHLLEHYQKSEGYSPYLAQAQSGVDKTGLGARSLSSGFFESKLVVYVTDMLKWIAAQPEEQRASHRALLDANVEGLYQMSCNWVTDQNDKIPYNTAAYDRAFSAVKEIIHRSEAWSPETPSQPVQQELGRSEGQRFR